MELTTVTVARARKVRSVMRRQIAGTPTTMKYAITIFTIESVSRVVHPWRNNWSRRTRGNVDLKSMIATMITIVLRKNQMIGGMIAGPKYPPRYNVEKRAAKAYSLMNAGPWTSMNNGPGYSACQPIMISDSASGRSNGKRSISAVEVTINRTAHNACGRMSHPLFC